MVMDIKSCDEWTEWIAEMGFEEVTVWRTGGSPSADASVRAPHDHPSNHKRRNAAGRALKINRNRFKGEKIQAKISILFQRVR